jgi:hypothetical protein
MSLSLKKKCVNLGFFGAVAMALFLLSACPQSVPDSETSPSATESATPSATVALTGISLNSSSLSLTKGGAPVSLTVSFSPSNASNTNVSWSSSNAAVATVSSSGAVSPVNLGSAVITATSEEGGLTATCAVTVSATADDLITDGGFASGSTYWKTETYGGATASMVFADGHFTLSGSGRGSQDWHLQLDQTGLHLQKRGIYRLSFDASSTVSGDKITAGIQEGGVTDVDSDGTCYTMWSRTEVFLGTAMESHSFDLIMGGDIDDNEARVNFGLGLSSSGTITIDNVSLVKVGTYTKADNELLYNGDFGYGQSNWTINTNDSATA